MSFETEARIIEQHFMDNFAESPTPLVGWNEHEFEPVKGGESVRLSISNGLSEQISMGSPGSNLIRNNGSIICEIFVPGGHGDRRARGITDSIVSVFMNQTLQNVRTRVPSFVGKRDDPDFLVWLVAVPFERDELNG